MRSTTSKNQLVIAQFLGTALPIPTTIAYDATSGNAILRQYTIQTRIRGSCLDSLYDSLPVEDDYVWHPSLLL